jgi:hypothetical protein
LYRMAKNNRSSRKVDLEWRLKQLWRTFYSWNKRLLLVALLFVPSLVYKLFIDF